MPAATRFGRDMAEAGLVIKDRALYQTRIPRSQRGGEVVEPMISAQWYRPHPTPGRQSHRRCTRRAHQDRSKTL